MFDAIRNKLQAKLSPERFRHSLGVSETAVELAGIFCANVEQARLAGLLHDCARDLSSNLLLHLAQAFDIVKNDVERQEPVLLHAPVGARLAQTEYGISDAAVLKAIAMHTTGGPAMTLLDKIIYLADAIEPGRSFAGVEKLRIMARKDIDSTLLAAYDQSIQYLLDCRGLIHPATIEGRNCLILEHKPIIMTK